MCQKHRSGRSVTAALKLQSHVHGEEHHAPAVTSRMQSLVRGKQLQKWTGTSSESDNSPGSKNIHDPLIARKDGLRKYNDNNLNTNVAVCLLQKLRSHSYTAFGTLACLVIYGNLAFLRGINRLGPVMVFRGRDSIGKLGTGGDDADGGGDETIMGGDEGDTVRVDGMFSCALSVICSSSCFCGSGRRVMPGMFLMFITGLLGCCIVAGKVVVVLLLD